MFSFWLRLVVALDAIEPRAIWDSSAFVKAMTTNQ